MTIAYFGTDTTGITYSGTQDAELLSALPTTNFSTETTNGGDNPFLLRFTGLSNIANQGFTITDAVLSLCVDSGDQNARTIIAKKCLRAWIEAEATWNKFASGSGSTNDWATPGCLGDNTDRVAANSCTIAYPGGYATGVRYNSTNNTQLIADVQAIADGGDNNGWWVRYSESVGLSLMLPAGDDGLRPLLTVTYSAASTQAPRSMHQFRQRRT